MVKLYFLTRLKNTFSYPATKLTNLSSKFIACSNSSTIADRYVSKTDALVPAASTMFDYVKGKVEEMAFPVVEINHLVNPKDVRLLYPATVVSIFDKY